MSECRILGVRLDVVNKENLEREVLATVKGKEKHLFAYANIHALNLAWDQPRFRELLNNAHIVYCDGEGVRLGARLLGYELYPRIVLTYWVWDLCRLFEEQGISVFFLGGREEVVVKAVNNVRARFPQLKVAGYHHGFFGPSVDENRKVVDAVNRVHTDVLFVGFGMPRQEYWIQENFSALETYAILPSGSLIDYVAGAKSLTPTWMANHGMEWVYRLSMEPGRLWKRYLIGNPLFILRILRQRRTERRRS